LRYKYNDIPLEVSETKPSLTGWKRKSYSEQNVLSMQHRVF